MPTISHAVVTLVERIARGCRRALAAPFLVVALAAGLALGGAALLAVGLPAVLGLVLWPKSRRPAGGPGGADGIALALVKRLAGRQET